MERDILFRGKNWLNGQWVYGDLGHDTHTHHHNITPVGGVSYPVVHETVGQYTGRTDKNGNKIFEGDIIRYIDPIGLSHTYEVIWNNKFCNWSVRYTDGHDCYGLWNVLEYNIEIIGNIYDNPGLSEEWK